MEENQDEVVKSRMQKIAKCVDGLLPNNYGFVVLAFSFDNENDNKKLMYASNSNREDIVEAMKEWIKKTENSFGKDI